MSGAKRSPMTDEQKARIDELAALGWKSKRIARAIGRHPSGVEWYLYANGHKAPAPTPTEQRTFVRGDRVCYRFTADEDTLILAERAKGTSVARIAELASERFNTARTKHAIHHRLVMLAARDEEPA